MKMKNLLTAVILFAVVFSVQSQNRENRDHDGFTGISVGGGVDLYIAQSDKFEVEVVSDKDLDKIETYVRSGVLYIKERGDSWSWNKKTEVYVKLPELEMLRASGGSDVENSGSFKGDKLELSSSGGSDVELDLTYNEIDIDCSGGSDVEMSGSTNILWLNSGGGSDFDGYDLEAKEANIRSTGGSDVSVYASERLEVNASGASDVRYRGNPKYTNLDSSGASDIDRG